MSCDNTIEIMRGQDLNIQITLLDITGNTIDGSIFKIVTVITHQNGQVVAKFSKNTATGYNVMDVSNESLGVIIVKLLSTHTASIPDGKLYQETHLQIADGASTDDGLLDLIASKKYCCTVIKSATGGLTLP